VCGKTGDAVKEKAGEDFSPAYDLSNAAQQRGTFILLVFRTFSVNSRRPILKH